jgi:hypothetical protein
VGLGVAVGEPLPLLLRPDLALAEIADRGDEVLLFVGELEVHAGGESIVASRPIGRTPIGS